MNHSGYRRSGHEGGSRLAVGSDEQGFTLVELLVAMFLVVVLFLAFGRALGGALQTSRDNRLAQQGTAIAMESIEYGRSLRWDELAMSEVNTSAALLTEAHDALSGTALGLGADEVLVVDEAGLVAPKTTVTVDATEYSTWMYVAESGSLRRLVVEVIWFVEDEPRDFRTSTLISEVSAG